MFAGNSSYPSRERDYNARREAAIADARRAYASKYGGSGYSTSSRPAESPTVMGSASPSARAASDGGSAGQSYQDALAAGELTGAVGLDAAASALSSIQGFGSLRGFVEGLEFDDLLIISLFFLLFNENKDDDILILLVLAALFFT